MEGSGNSYRSGVKLETHVRVEQTARGVWYCSNLDVYADNSISLKVDLDNAMSLVEELLLKHNQPHDTGETHHDLKVGGMPLRKPPKVKL